MKDKLVLYGSGKRCNSICKILRQFQVQSVTVLDSDPMKWSSKVAGYLIESPEKMRELQNAYLCITVANIDAVKMIREELQRKYQYNFEREISYNRLILEIYEKNIKIDKNLPKRGRADYGKESVLFGCRNGFRLGGIEEWTIGLCEALIKSGKKEVYVVAQKGSYTVPTMLKHHMIYADIDPKVKFAVDSIRNLMKGIMEKLPCKVITTQPDEIMVAAYLVKHYYPDLIEIISTIRGGQEQIYESYMGFRKCPDVYIGVSQDIKKEMIQRGIKPEKVLTMCVPFACEETLDRIYTEDCLIPICIGYAGRMENAQKRMDLLIELIKELNEKKVNFQMELAGDGPMRDEMENFVSANHLNSKVVFLGRIQRSEIPDFWKRQDICVNIADFEGRSHSIIEAMGNGAVPVVTATSGVRDDITDGENGYIVPLGDYHTMADRIAYLEKHRERLNEMGRLAHDAVYPKSQMENHLKFWEDVFSHKLWKPSRV